MLKSTEQVSFTVSNLGDSLLFFCDILLGLTASPIAEVD